MYAALSAFTVLALAAGESAGPRPALEVHVTHGSNTSTCPDESGLRARLAAAETWVDVDGPVRLDVHFDRAAGAREYQAIVRASGARSGVRALTVAGDDCGPLAEALTVSMLLFLDPQAQPEPSPPNDQTTGSSTGSVSSSPSQPAVLPMPRSPPQRHSSKAPVKRARGRPFERRAPLVGVVAALTPTLAFGFTPHFTGGGELSVAARPAPFSAWLAVSAFVPRSMEFGEGSVRGWFVAARVSLCTDFPVGRAYELGTCAALLAARLSVRGEGYRLDNDMTVRPLWGFGPEVRVAAEIAPSWGLLARGALFFVPRRESFSIEPTGRAFGVGPVAGWVGVGVWTKIQ